MEYKWLTLQEVADYKKILAGLEERMISAPLFAPMIHRLIDDRQEAIRLCDCMVSTQRPSPGFQKAVDDIDAMLKVTTDYD